MPTIASEQRGVRVKILCDALGLGYNTLYRMLESGELAGQPRQCRGNHTRWLVDPRSARELVASHLRKARADVRRLEAAMNDLT